MVMPVMTKLYKITGNKLYLDKLYEYFSYANSIMYDGEEKLYYRDAKYVYPAHKSANGKKDFWARGDGWVFAGLAKVLTDLPKNDAHRNEYLTKFKGMAEAIKSRPATGRLLDKKPARLRPCAGTGNQRNSLFYLWFAVGHQQWLSAGKRVPAGGAKELGIT